MSIRLVLAFLALVGVERLVGAETTGSPEPAELVRQLVARIEQLEKRVNELEGNKVTTVSLARPPGAALAPAVSALTPVESMHQAHEVKLDPSEDALTRPHSSWQVLAISISAPVTNTEPKAVSMKVSSFCISTPRFLRKSHF